MRLGDETSTSEARAIPCCPKPVRRSRRVPLALASVIDRCLSPDPAERPSVDELIAQLGMIVSEGRVATRKLSATRISKRS